MVKKSKEYRSVQILKKSKRIPSTYIKKSDGSERKVKTKSMPPQTKKEFNRVIDAVYAKNRIVAHSLHMQSLTGLRYSDVSVLIWSDFYDGKVINKSFDVIQQKVYHMVFTRLTLTGVAKKEADRKAKEKANVTVYINKAIINLLEDIAVLNPNITGQELLFANKHKRSGGTALAIRSVNKILGQVKAELELNYTLGTHSFRKYLALNLLNNNANIAEIRDLLGHNNVKSTDSYLHSFSGNLGNLIDKLNY